MSKLVRSITKDEIAAYNVAGVVLLRGILDLGSVNTLRRCIDEAVNTMGQSPSGYDMSVILTPPGGTAFLLNSRPFIRGYDYTAGVLTIYGTFQSGQASLYIGSSLVPLKAVPQTDRIVLNMKPADGVTTVTVYQTGGACDSVVVRLR